MEMRGQQKREFHVHLERRDGYRFESQASEDGRPHGAPFYSDEPDPVGSASAPATPALLGAAIGHCLSASLLEALRHAHIPVESLGTDVDCVVIPNDEGLPRIDRVDVVIRPALPVMAARAHRCAELFENHCTVTSSVREGIEVNVRVDWQVHSSGNGAGMSAAVRPHQDATSPAGTS
jgi:uncharacterized OsmC-like protein